MHCPQCNTPYEPGSIFCDNCGASLSHYAPAVPPPYMQPPVIDRLIDTAIVGEHGTYLIKRQIASGGQSKVYEAQWLDRNRQVCVKVFDEKFKDYIETEKSVLTTLHHPNIIRIFDGATISNSADLSLIIEFVAGGSVENRLEDVYEPLSTSQIMAIIGQVASALDYVHNAGFVHCDIKPSNILLDDFRVVLSDFGIVKPIGDCFAEAVGTPLYSAPEQLNGKPVTVATDIYSFGIVAYEMLLRKHLTEVSSDSTRITGRISADLPEQISRIVLKALSKEPDQRYSSIKEFADQLVDAILANSASLTVTPMPPPPLVSSTTYASAPPVQLSYPLQFPRAGLIERIRVFFRGNKPSFDSPFGYTKAVATQRIVESSVEDLQDIRDRLLLDVDKAIAIATNELEGGSKVQNECLETLRDQKLRLMQVTDENKIPTFIEVQFRLQLLYGTFRREHMTEAEERNWRWIVPAIILLYAGIVVAVVLFGSQLQSSAADIPVIGIPLSVLVWAGIGSLAAILYRFYTRRIGRLGNEIKWLVARPIIGIIMGALAYLAILSGLFIFGGATGTNVDIQSTKPQLIWLLAFLGGFSDRFFEAIIDNLLGRLSHSNGEATKSDQAAS